MTAELRLACLLMTLLAAPWASAAHITDKLLAGLYEQPASGLQPLKLLPSGTPVEVLERKTNFQRIRLDDGTEGWVNASYVTEEKPAKAMLLESQARVIDLERQLAAVPQPNDCPPPPAPRPAAVLVPAAASATPPAPATGVVADCVAAETALADLQVRVLAAGQLLGMTPAAGAKPLQLLDRSLDWPWLVLPLVLLAGFAAGVATTKLRIRRRLGGVRV